MNATTWFKQQLKSKTNRIAALKIVLGVTGYILASPAALLAVAPYIPHAAVVIGGIDWYIRNKTDRAVDQL